MVLWLERKTLIHEVVGSIPVSGVIAPQIRGLDESASGIGQEKSPTIVRLAPGEVPQSRLAGSFQSTFLAFLLEKCSIGQFMFLSH